LTLDDLADGLEHASGLAGLSGHGGDMRDARRATAAGDPNAALALEVYAHHLRQAIAAKTASLGGIDLLVFTGGVGEHDAALRAETAAGLGFLGITLDDERNRDASGDARLSAPDAAVTTWVITAREDIEIAAQTRAALRAR
ncbi:acetate/propionate family kinase, partial [Actinokineospora sp. NPDC004072]